MYPNYNTQHSRSQFIFFSVGKCVPEFLLWIPETYFPLAVRGGGEVEPWQWVGGLGVKFKRVGGYVVTYLEVKVLEICIKQGIYDFCVCKLVTACMKLLNSILLNSRI